MDGALAISLSFIIEVIGLFLCCRRRLAALVVSTEIVAHFSVRVVDMILRISKFFRVP